MVTNQIIEKLAAREATTATRCVEGMLPPRFASSVFLFQPIAGDNHPLGRLVDVAPRPSGSPSGLIYQPTGAGHTGTFLQAGDAGEVFDTLPQTIDETTIQGYLGSMPDELRRRQITLEKLRYPDVSFIRPDRPPVGATIYHLTLAPPSADLRYAHLPVLGLLYTLEQEQTERSLRTRRFLIHISQCIGRTLLQNRVKVLWGPNTLRCIRSHVDPTRVGFEGEGLLTREAALVWLAFRYLFSHHWFFPHRPSAWSLLTERSSGRRWYEKLHWTPPLPGFDSMHGADGALVEQVTDDFIHLCCQASSHTGSPGLEHDLLTALDTVITLLTGRLAWLPAQHEQVIHAVPSSRPIRDGLVMVLPRPEAAKSAGQHFVFEVKKIRKSLRDRPQRKKNIDNMVRLLRPGADIGKPGRLRYSEPTFSVSLCENGQVHGRKIGSNEFDKLIAVFSLFIIEERIACSDQGERR